MLRARSHHHANACSLSTSIARPGRVEFALRLSRYLQTNARCIVCVQLATSCRISRGLRNAKRSQFTTLHNFTHCMRSLLRMTFGYKRASSYCCDSFCSRQQQNIGHFRSSGQQQDLKISDQADRAQQRSRSAFQLFSFTQRRELKDVLSDSHRH